MIGRGELRREREGGGEDGKQHMKHMVFLSTAAFKGIFVLKRSFKKKKKEWSSTEQASNETVPKNFWRYFIKSRQKILPYHREWTLNP